MGLRNRKLDHHQVEAPLLEVVPYLMAITTNDIVPVQALQGHLLLPWGPLLPELVLPQVLHPEEGLEVLHHEVMTTFDLLYITQQLVRSSPRNRAAWSRSPSRATGS